MKTNPLKSLFGLATVATALSGNAFAQDHPMSSLRPSAQVFENGAWHQPKVGETFHIGVTPHAEWDQLVRKAMADAKDGEHPQLPKMEHHPQWQLGVMAVPVEPVLRMHLELPEGSGLRVSKVIEGSPAAKAGIVENDIIVAAGDQKIDSLESLRGVVQKIKIADNSLVLEVIHKGKSNSVKITKTFPPENPETHRDNPEKRPFAEMGMLMQQQNRRYEEMRGALKEMRQQLEKQQLQIRELEKSLAERNERKENPRHKRVAPYEGEKRKESKTEE